MKQDQNCHTLKFKTCKHGPDWARRNATERDRQTDTSPKSGSFFPFPSSFPSFFRSSFLPLLHFVRCLDVSEVKRSVDHSTATDTKCCAEFLLRDGSVVKIKLRDLRPFGLNIERVIQFQNFPMTRRRVAKD